MKDSKFSWLWKSWTMYFAAFVMAAPDLLAFLPTIKSYIPEEWYPWMIRLAGAGFIILRIKTQAKK